MSIHWYVETSHLDDPHPPLWTVEVTGHPGIRIAVDLVKHPDDRSRMSAEQYAVAGQVINAIPYVVAAPPGLLTRPVATPARDDYLSFVPPAGLADGLAPSPIRRIWVTKSDTPGLRRGEGVSRVPLRQRPRRPPATRFPPPRRSAPTSDISAPMSVTSFYRF